jgi:DNA-binding response OmpR family regulator
MATILLIENEASLRVLYSSNLKARQHTVYAASDLKDVYDYLSLPIDCIILDIPYGSRQERQLLEYLNICHQAIPVILTCTSLFLLYNNVGSVLLKPFPIDHLLKSLP